MKKLLLAACLFLACHPTTSAATQTKAPNFTLRDINGDSYSLYEHQGEIIILNFWATWCGPCKTELPHLNAIDKAYSAQGVDVVVISVDAARETSKAKSYIKSRKYEFTALFDTDTSVVSQYNPSKAIPFTLIMDREMRIIHVHTGYVSGVEDTYVQIIEEMLANESR
jgi:peroxiredoxin